MRRPDVAQRDRGLDAFVGERRRQPDVCDHEVGVVLLDRLDDAFGSVELRHGLVAVAGEEAHDPLLKEDRVLDDHDPHGSSARIVVGPPTGLATRSVPSSERTRSARPLRPPPGLGSGAALSVVGDLDAQRAIVVGSR